MSRHATLYYDVLCCSVLYHVRICNDIQCFTMRCLMYAMLCFAVRYYATLCYAILCHAMLHSAVLCYTMLCYALLWSTMLCYTMLCYTLLCHATLYYDMPWKAKQSTAQNSEAKQDKPKTPAHQPRKESSPPTKPNQRCGRNDKPGAGFRETNDSEESGMPKKVKKSITQFQANRESMPKLSAELRGTLGLAQNKKRNTEGRAQVRNNT